MAGGFITINVMGQRTERQLVTFGVQIRDLAPAWEQVGERLLDDFTANFATEGALFAAGGWPELAGGTVAERAAAGYGGAHPILVRTGYLEDSIEARGAPGNVFEVTPESVTVGTDVPYAVFHQAGTTRMPARPVVGLSWTAETDVVNILNTYIAERVAEANMGL